MRITLYNTSDRLVGGSERYLRALAGALHRSGHAVSLLHEGDAPANRERIFDGPSWSSASSGPQKAVREALRWRPDIVFVSGFLQVDNLREIGTGAPVFYFCQDYVGTCVTGEKRHKFPVVQPCPYTFGAGCLLRYYPRRCGGLHPGTMWNRYRRESARLAQLRTGDAVVTASRAMREQYLSQDFPGDRLFCVPLGCERSEPVERTIPDVPFRLLFSGRFEDIKGGDLLLDALPKAARQLGRKLHLTFVGDGRRRPDWEMKARAVSAGCDLVEVDFRGWLGSEELDAVSAQTDLVVMPGTWPEPFGLSGLEAGRFRIPTVAFALGGIPDWLEEGVNGCLASADPPHPSAFADAIARCFHDPFAYRRMCFGAAAATQHFSIENHLGQLMSIFESTLRRKTANASAS